MPTVINGLPAHVLLIHVLVVLGPLGALFTVLSAVWPKARRKLGIISPATCAIVLVATPITQNAGEWLEHKLEQNGENKAIAKHADLGDTFLWFAIGLFVVSAAVWWVGSTATLTRSKQRTALPVWVGYAVAVLAVVVSVLVVWQLYRIGDSGAHASWDYVQKLK